MWLPKDERYLLLGYYFNMFDVNDRDMCKPGEEKWFKLCDWREIFKVSSWIPIRSTIKIKQSASGVKSYADREVPVNSGSFEQMKKEIPEILNAERRIGLANVNLQGRGLIDVREHNSERDVAGISLTTEGYDLGRKYSNWWDRTGLWYKEQRGHWFWLILSYIVGVLSAILVRLF